MVTNLIEVILRRYKYGGLTYEKNEKIIIGSSIALVLIILISTIVLALFTLRQEETAKINIGNLDVILVEDWPEDVPEIGLERKSKTVKGESVAEKKHM